MKENYDPLRRWGCAAVTALWLLTACLIVFICLSLPSCSPRTVYVPTTEVRTEYRDRDVERVVTDTVRDNRFVFVKGDTVVDIRDRWHRSTEYVHDTCYIERHDSIPVPYPVERELSRWEQTKMDLGGFALGGLMIALCIAVIWLIRKFRR